MAKISEAQTAVIQYARYHIIGDNFYCEIGDGISTATIMALVNKGYLTDANSHFGKYFLTDKGVTLRDELND